MQSCTWGVLQFDDEIKDEMKDIIKNKYGGIDDFTAASLSMSYVMLNVSTCTCTTHNAADTLALQDVN